MLTFIFKSGTTVFGQIWCKISRLLFQLKNCTEVDLNMENLAVMLTFVLDQSDRFWGNLAQKLKIVISS